MHPEMIFRAKLVRFSARQRKSPVRCACPGRTQVARRAMVRPRCGSQGCQAEDRNGMTQRHNCRQSGPVGGLAPAGKRPTKALGTRAAPAPGFGNRTPPYAQGGRRRHCAPPPACGCPQDARMRPFRSICDLAGIQRVCSRSRGDDPECRTPGKTLALKPPAG